MFTAVKFGIFFGQCLLVCFVLFLTDVTAVKHIVNILYINAKYILQLQTIMQT